MAYRIKTTARLDSEVRRLLLAQIDEAHTLLEARSDVAVAVHESRKSMKRARALLRLTRGGLKPVEFRREDQTYRTVGKLLAAERDRFVMTQTVARLTERCACDEDRRALLAAGRLFKSPATNGNEAALDDAKVQQALDLLATSRRRIRKLALRPARIEILADGFAQCYADARRALKVAHKTNKDDDFHDLRRKLQRHWRHLQLLSQLWPELMEVRIASARHISQLLGDEHDCSVLGLHVAAASAAQISPAERDLVIALARAEQSRLRQEAGPLAARLLVQAPRDVHRFVTDLWPLARRITLDARERKEAASTSTTQASKGTIEP